MKTYLSIDLDYWGTRPWTDSSPTLKRAEKCLSKALNIDVPKVIVFSHEQIIDYIDDFEKCINVDYHSDMCARDTKLKEPQNYDWVNHLPCTGHYFEWRHPYDHIDNGLCDTEVGDFFTDSKINYGWEKVSRKKGLRGIWKDVTGIGIALSPEWTHKKTIDLFLNLLKKEPIYREFKKILDKGYRSEKNLSCLRLEQHWSKFKNTIFIKKEGDEFFTSQKRG